MPRKVYCSTLDYKGSVWGRGLSPLSLTSPTLRPSSALHKSRVTRTSHWGRSGGWDRFTSLRTEGRGPQGRGATLLPPYSSRPRLDCDGRGSQFGRRNPSLRTGPYHSCLIPRPVVWSCAPKDPYVLHSPQGRVVDTDRDKTPRFSIPLVDPSVGS